MYHKKNKIKIHNQKFYVKIKNPNKYVIRSKLGTNITQENCILVNFLSDSIKNECENKNVCENKTKQNYFLGAFLSGVFSQIGCHITKL